MAFFDALMNLSPEQNQGLLAAAAQILQASGPSRTPTSFGQILGGGLQAFQQGLSDAEQRRVQREQQAMDAKLMGLKLKDAESDLANQQAARDRAARLQQFYAGESAGASGMLKIPSSAQITSQFRENRRPEWLTSENMPNAQQPKAQLEAIQANASPVGLFQQRIAQAQRLRAAGFAPEADAAELQALKFQPKVKEWNKVRQDGKILYKPYFEDGSSGEAVPYEVAEKLEKINLGGTTALVGEFSGNQLGSFRNTASPDALLSAETARRGQNLVNERAKEEIAAGGKPPPGYRWTPQGTLQAIPGGPGDKLPESQQKQVVGVNNLSNAIAEYRSQLKDFNKLDTLKPDARATMGTKYNNMMLQAKEAYNLGVLNGPDLEILTNVITDPRSLRGAITSKEALDTQASELDRIMRQVGSVSSQSRQPQQVERANAAPVKGKTISLADIAETARKSGRTTAEVTAAARAKGYTIGGQ